MVNYDVWRATDRQFPKASGKQHCVAKFWIPPADLVKLFGMPDTTEIFFQGSGQFTFEDTNLDTYCLYDYKQTQLYHGLDREDDYYTTKRNLKKPLHKRQRKWPTIQEFWTSTEPKEFKLATYKHAEWRKFRRWLRRQLESVSSDSLSFMEINEPKYLPELDVCHGDWDTKYTVNTEMIAHKYDWTYHMSPEELKAFKGELPEKVVPPKMFDLSKAERVAVDRHKIKLEQVEKEQARMQ